MPDKKDRLFVHDWEDHQSYRSDRGQPPWIKLHRSLLRDAKFLRLSDPEKLQIIMIWLLAADNNGAIENDPALITQLTGLDFEIDLKYFVELGFLDANVTPRRRQLDANLTPDANVASQSREEKNREEQTHAGARESSSLNEGSQEVEKAVRIIEILDQEIVKAFGEDHARARPVSTDLESAEFIDDFCGRHNLGDDGIRFVIKTNCERRAAKQQSPPGSLSYFTKAICEAAKTPNNVVPIGEQATPPKPRHVAPIEIKVGESIVTLMGDEALVWEHKRRALKNGWFSDDQYQQIVDHLKRIVEENDEQGAEA